MKSFVRRLLLDSAIGLGCLLLLAEQSTALAGQQVLVYGLSEGDISNLDPARFNVSVEYPIIRTVMEGLVDFPAGNVSEKVEPALAERWEVSTDGRVYTFYLRKGVKFHGGYGELTAGDVKFSIDRYRNKDESTWAARYENVTKVSVIDDYTVQVTLSSPDLFFLASLATTYDKAGSIMSKKAFDEKGPAGMRLNPIGTGPFKFESYKPKENVVLARNEEYWGGRPALEKVVYKFIPSPASREFALLAGEIHTMRPAFDPLTLTRLEGQGFKVDLVGPETYWGIYLDTEKSPFNDIRVRKAVAHAINKKELLPLYGKTAIVAETIYPLSFSGAIRPEDVPADARAEFSLEKAKLLLAEAGHPNGFQTSMIITERSDYRDLMLAVQSQLRRVGINVQLNVVDHTSYHSQITKGVNPIILFGNITFPDAAIVLRDFFHSAAIVGKPTGSRNFSRYDDTEFDSLLDKARNARTIAERSGYLVQAQKRVMKQFVFVPLVFTRQPLVRSPKVDLGYELNLSLLLNYRFGVSSRLLE